MYPNGQNGFNGAPPEGNFLRKPPALFTAADFTVSPFDGPERGREEKRAQKNQTSHELDRGGALLTLAFETVFMTLAVTFLWRSD